MVINTLKMGNHTQKKKFGIFFKIRKKCIFKEDEIHTKSWKTNIKNEN